MALCAMWVKNFANSISDQSQKILQAKTLLNSIVISEEYERNTVLVFHILLNYLETQKIDSSNISFLVDIANGCPSTTGDIMHISRNLLRTIGITRFVSDCDEERLKPRGTDNSDFSEISWSVFPNPSKDEIRIVIENSQELVDFVIKDAYGKVFRVLKNIDSRYSEKIDISDLPNGLYFIEYRNNNKPLDIRKFLKAN